ncbi:hypothetical protein [Mycolicibacterium sp. YH-1]|uniref:hypothetical protein n=1 Tax=Mycolicibacterium sp. YH-1 TaxID=2908837 RepID=UPI001F4BDDED|nr:hypothetical protein [Mycolicibacterium sp. YH-1]UNB54570.1 hypothetical protein L0M16_09745 [Mycolicibacterium sp. YH-1]
MTASIFDGINIESADSTVTVEALTVFGFQPASQGAEVSRAISPQGFVELEIHRPGSLPDGSGRAVFFGLDIYTSNADLSGRLADSAGWVVNPPVPYWTGGHPIIESRAYHPVSALTVFAAQTPPALAVATCLDTEPGRLHSDVVTAVWFIEHRDVDREIEFWTSEFGLQQFETTTWYDARSQAALFQLDTPRRIGGAMFVDPDQTRMLEILFLEGGGLLRPGPDGSGLHSVSFASGKSVSATPLGQPTRGRGQFFESPAGIIYELRE